MLDTRSNREYSPNSYLENQDKLEQVLLPYIIAQNDKVNKEIQIEQYRLQELKNSLSVNNADDQKYNKNRIVLQEDHENQHHDYKQQHDNEQYHDQKQSYNYRNCNNELYGYKNHNRELPLKEVEMNSYLPEVLNPEHYRPKGHPPK
ncbi:20752_t:CDS:2 [Racocetra persica]|uniref:20752_t:CDS:1 n=1 Tax=Racocetra persica TaxID=160502 RepID=A0ACA9LRZ9_9GLOM|nr:20752_t:CDS:2 [Racocetra persica]